MKRCERAKADVGSSSCFARQLLAVEAIRLFFNIRAKRVPCDCFPFSMLLDKFYKLHQKLLRSPSCSRVSTGTPGRRSEFVLTQRMIKTDSDPDLVLVFFKKFSL